ncbi:MAG TPA: NADPH-dependent F420 reductase [Polyangia bacterium]|jgi:predicted dinucleotide-binding enzyme|nr:NADPH-dependent F420 reductase [Polyangia bacterium]
MRIGVIGAGMIGGTVGRLLHAAGHEVRFGTRHPDALERLVAELGARASAGTPREAVTGGDAVLLAVPLHAVPAVAREIGEAAAGQVVLDACNAYPSRDGEAAHTATKHAAGSSGWVASHLPGSKIVKAFNTVYFKVLASESRRGAADGVGIPLAGDDDGALATARRLVEDAGFSPVVVGPLATGKLFEPGTPVYNTGLHASDVARALGVAR